jgi:uncharacterized membrane protein
MEEIAKQITVNVSHAVEILAAIIIGIAVIKTAIQFFKPPLGGGLEGLRIKFGSSVAVSLELLLGADVLATAVAPSWDDIGKLAAIAILRTALNYFLEKELKHMNAMDVSQQHQSHVLTHNDNGKANYHPMDK